MREFYAVLLGGAAEPAAWSRARPHPQFWAGFGVHVRGEGRAAARTAAAVLPAVGQSAGSRPTDEAPLAHLDDRPGEPAPRVVRLGSGPGRRPPPERFETVLYGPCNVEGRETDSEAVLD